MNFGDVRALMNQSTPWDDSTRARVVTLIIEVAQQNQERYASEWLPYLATFKDRWGEPLMTCYGEPELERMYALAPFALFRTRAHDLRLLARSESAQRVCTIDASVSRLGEEDMRALAASPYLHALKHLDLNHNHLGARGAEALAREFQEDQLESLSLSYNRLLNKGVEALAMSRVCGRLTQLDLSRNKLGGDALDAMSNSLPMARLSYVNLSQNRFDRQAMARWSAPHFSSTLTRLNLSRCKVDGPGWAAMTRQCQFSQLEWLDVSDNELGASGVEALAAWEGVRGLNYVNVRNNLGFADGDALSSLIHAPIMRTVVELDAGGHMGGDALCQALASSDMVSSLETLDLATASISAHGMRTLCEATNMPRLTHLNLAGNFISTEGIRALASCEWVGRLTSLYLSGNRVVMPEAVVELLRSPLVSNLRELSLPVDASDDAEVRRALRDSPYVHKQVKAKLLG